MDGTIRRLNSSILRNAPNNGPVYDLRTVCAASALLNKQAFLDGLGMIPGEGNLLKSVQFTAGAIAAGWTIFGDSSPMDGVLSGTGSGITAVDTAKVMTTGAEIVPVIGNFVAAYATYRDIWGSDGLVANYDNCLAGKN